MSTDMQPAEETLADIPYSLIKTDPGQPRLVFKDEDIKQRARSIKTHGLKTRIKVRRSGENFILISGEMRYRAIGRLNWETVPAIIVSRELSEADLILDQMVDNMERSDLLPSEEALAYQRLIDLKGWNFKEVAESLNISKSRVSDTMRLLALPPDILAHVDRGRIGRGNAVRLTRLASSAKQERLAQELLQNELTASELAAEVRKSTGRVKRAKVEESNRTRMSQWKVSVGRGMKLYFTSKVFLEPHILIGNVFDGLRKLMRQELAETTSEEMPDLEPKALLELLQAFATGGIDLEIELQKQLRDIGPMVLLSLLSTLSSEDPEVRRQAKTALGEVSGQFRMQFRQIIALAEGREEELQG